MNRAGKIALWTLGSLAGVAAAGFAFLQTGPGRGWVAATLTKSLSTPASTIAVGKIDGLVPFDISVDRVALGDTVQQSTFFSALALILWAHRLPWAGGSLPGLFI